MMVRRIFLFAWLGMASCMVFNARCSMLMAQEKFTDRLRQSVAGQGTVRLYQDADIEELVNGKRTATPAQANDAKRTSSSQLPDTTDVQGNPAFGLGHKVRMNGYRVQVYSGGNSRDAKNRAYQMENLVKAYAPGQAVYTRFVSPRWICHVGDFQTREEALEFLEELRKTGRFAEAITVKSKINVMTYDE